MEDNDRYCVDLKYWKVKERGDWLWIYCPALTEGVDNFGDKRRILKELKIIEEVLPDKYLGWIGYTKLEHWHIMRMYAKVGAKPYGINLEHNTLWFAKRIRSKNGSNTIYPN
jgi:hypothetical protein